MSESSTASSDTGRGCAHRQLRCLRCGNVGCTERTCAAYGFELGLCRSCGHIENMPAR